MVLHIFLAATITCYCSKSTASCFTENAAATAIVLLLVYILHAFSHNSMFAVAVGAASQCILFLHTISGYHMCVVAGFNDTHL